MKLGKLFFIAAVLSLAMAAVISCSDDDCKGAARSCAGSCPSGSSGSSGDNAGQENSAEGGEILPDFVCGTGQGDSCGVLAVNVFDEENRPVPGINVYVNDYLLGITGGIEFGTMGYIKRYVKEGEYMVLAENSDQTRGGSTMVSVSPLEVVNGTVFLKTYSCDSIDCGEHGTCDPETVTCDCTGGYSGPRCGEPPAPEKSVYVCEASNYDRPLCIDLLASDGWDQSSADTYCAGMDDTGAGPRAVFVTFDEACQNTLDPAVLVKCCEATTDQQGTATPLAYIYAVDAFPDPVCGLFLGGVITRPPFDRYDED